MTILFDLHVQECHLRHLFYCLSPNPNTSVGLNGTSTKKVVNFSGEEKCTPERKSRVRVYEKRASPYIGTGLRPRMIYPALHSSYEEPVAEFMRVSNNCERLI